MKKTLLLLTALLALCFAAEAQEIMYVTSPDGLRVRSAPSLQAKTIDTLYYGEYVLAAEKGAQATIDGITANWVKTIFCDEDDAPKEFGWVFGGYLSEKQPELGGDAFSFIKSYFEKSGKGYYLAPYFPEEYNTFYYRTEEDWENEVGYDCALENLCQENYYPEKKAVTIRECMYYQPPKAACLVGSLSIIPAGTQIRLWETGEYGIKGGVLFPIYEFETVDGYTHAMGYIRGIDITAPNLASSVSDGKGGSYMLHYQRALKSVNSGDYGYSKEKIDEALNNTWTYEGAELKGGFKMTCVLITDPSGIERHDFGDFDTKAYSLELEYPLNMKNPVLFLKENLFSGGMGGGYISTRLSTTKLLSDSRIVFDKVFEYGYLSVDAGYDGMAYHYFTENGAVVYEYQTDEMGNVEHNRHKYYVRKSNFLYSFWDGETIDGEPAGKSQTLKVGQYANPVCRLKMRARESLSAEKIGTLEAGTLLQVTEVGSKAAIDGITANWVKVRAVNGGSFAEGNSTDGAAGWVFGGYLE